MTWSENWDLQNIITLVDADRLETLLRETNYNKTKTAYLINRFKNEFSIEYEGNREVQRTSPNLKFTIGDEFELWEKVMKGVTAARYVGPF